MRRIVGVLRSEPERRGADWEPAPALADIPDLVQRASDRDTLVVHGVPPRVSPERTTYRPPVATVPVLVRRQTVSPA